MLYTTLPNRNLNKDSDPVKQEIKIETKIPTFVAFSSLPVRVKKLKI